MKPEQAEVETLPAVRVEGVAVVENGNGHSQESAIVPFQNASMLVITESENKILDENFADAIIQIRPDGLIYLEQVFYRERLNKAFGRGQWSLVPVKEWTEGLSLFYLGELYVRGAYVARACGCHTKQ
jgi:hypothetical protein